MSVALDLILQTDAFKKTNKKNKQTNKQIDIEHFLVPDPQRPHNIFYSQEALPSF